MLFALGGQTILDYLHVSVPALQGAEGGDDGFLEATPEQRTSIALVPLGTPLLAGPGAIVATILFFNQTNSFGEWMSVSSAIALALSVSFIAMRFSGIIQRVVRPMGVLLLARVAGMILAAIAVQMIADSVTAFVRNA